MYNATSFTQKAFLNSFYMDYLNPSDCEEQRVQNPQESVIDTLNNLEFNPYQASYKGNLHRVMKPIRVVARMVYALFVTLIIAPLGALYHGAYTAKNLGSWAVKALILKDSTSTEDKEKAGKHAISMLSDIWQLAIGFTCGLPILTFNLVPLWNTIVLLPLSFFGLGGWNPQNFLPTFIASSDDMVGMTISLKLRNELGLVGPDGGLLPFSKQDNVKFSRKSSQLFNHDFRTPSKTIRSMQEMIMNAEMELIEQVREVNGASHGFNINYQYPFDGNKLAEVIPDPKLAQKFKDLQRKIDVLRSILKEAAEFAMNGGFLQYVLRDQKKEGGMLPYFLPSSYLRSDSYYKYFNTGIYENINDDVVREPIKDFLNGLTNIPTILSGVKLNQSVSFYEKFKQKVGIAKGKKTEPDLCDLFFIPRNYTKDSLTKQYRYLAMVTHPDKHGSLKEAQELFQLVSRIYDELKKRFN